MAARKSATSVKATVAPIATPDQASKVYKATVAGRISWLGEMSAFTVKTGKNAGGMVSVFRFEMISTCPATGTQTRYKCSVLGEQSLIASKLVKGHTVMVTGNYSLESYTSKVTGEAATSHAIKVDFLN